VCEPPQASPEPVRSARIFPLVIRAERRLEMIRIEIDDADPLAKQLMALSASVQERQEKAERESEARVVDMGEDGRIEDLETAPRVVRPPQDRFEEVFRTVMAVGTGEMLSSGRYPNTVFNINKVPRREHQKGERLQLPIHAMYIGAEVIAMTATPEDGPNWSVQRICFANLNLIGGGFVPLSALTYLTQKDLLSVFAGRRTIVDVLVDIELLCKKDGATFDGFNLFMNLEEQPLQIQTRIR
jgi:hypothetical protein